MGIIEIAIIAAAGIFLLWLWRGGGQPKPVVATADCAAPCCGPPRAFGCFGLSFALLIAAGLLILGILSHSRLGVLVALLAGVALVLFTGRWGRSFAVLGVLAFAAISMLAVVGMFAIRVGSQHVDQENLHWVDDWLDGPAAQFSPFHRARLEQARAELQREHARTAAEIDRWHTLGRLRGPNGSLPIPVELPSDSSSFGDPTATGATLNIDLKPNALAQGNVSPDALAATLLAMIDLIASENEADAAPVKLSSLYQMDVQPRAGKAIPLSQIALIRKESRKGAANRIARIAVTTSDKSKRPESEQIRQAYEYLAGIVHDRQSQSGQAGFQIRYHDSTLLIMIEPRLTGDIPVEAALTAVNPAAPAAVAPPVAAPEGAAPPVAPAAPAPTVVAAPPKKLKSPVEGTVVDLWSAYQLMMWTLPESLGGAAEFQQTTYDFAPVAAIAPPAAAIAAPAAEVALAQDAAPVATVESAVQPTERSTATPVAPIATAPAGVPASATAVTARPAWLDGKPEYLDSEGAYYLRRSTGRVYETPDESHEAAAELLLNMTDDYVTSLLGKDAASRVSIPIHTVLHDFVESTWDEHGPPPGLPDDDAWETHVLLKFDASDRQLVEQTWQHSVVDRNLRYAGAGAGLVLALMGTVFGYLKVDTATRGYYSGRLKLATGAIVAAITTLGILLMAGTLRL